MKKLSTLVAGLYLSGCLLDAGAAATNPVDQFITTYSKTYAELGLGGEMELSYVKTIQSLVLHTDMQRQHGAFDELARQLKLLEPRDSNPCQHLQLQQIAFELELNQQKLSLLDRYLALGKQAILSDKGLAETSMGRNGTPTCARPG